MAQLGKSAAELAAEESKNKADADFNSRNNEPKLEQSTPPQNNEDVKGPMIVSGDIVPSNVGDRALDKVIPPTEAVQVQEQINTKLSGIADTEALRENTTVAKNVQPKGAVTEVQQPTIVAPVTEGHMVTITPNLQGHFKFKAVCNCAWQGLFETMDEAIERAKLHKKLRNVRPF